MFLIGFFAKGWLNPMGHYGRTRLLPARPAVLSSALESKSGKQANALFHFDIPALAGGFLGQDHFENAIAQTGADF